MCPGVRDVWPAADGGLARVRIPGGVLTADQLEVLATAAAELGSGVLELTKRANLQVRGLRPGAEDELACRLHAADLLPSDAHDKVRNLVASPLTGLVSDRPDVLPVVRAIDAGLLADPAFADLPGRFLFVVDDGAYDVAGLDADVSLIAELGRYALHLGGAALGTVRDPAAAALAAARGFVAERGAQCSPAWRLAELDDGPARVAARLGPAVMHDRVDISRAESGPNLSTGSCRTGRPVGLGLHRQTDGRVALAVEVPEGRLDVAGALALAARSTGEIRVTPWRSVVLPNLEAGK